jgi:hypothetical protein
MAHPISVQELLELLADFDKDGGASVGEVAWDFCVAEEQVAAAWSRATSDGLMRPSDHDEEGAKHRLTEAGWGACHGALGHA